MKKNLSLAGIGLAAMGLFMGSCVSKRKYVDAQTSAAERYRTDSTEWANRANSMQQNITSLEEKSASYQKQMDSFKTAATNYQQRWEGLQTTYTTQNTSTEQLHQQIHSAIDQYVEPSNVESRNGKVYVNLPEKLLFASGGSALSAKGKEALEKLAEILTTNENVEVDIIASAAYYNSGMETAGTTPRSSNNNMNAQANADKNMNVDNNDNANANNNTETKKKETADADQPTSTAKANIGDSAYPGSGAKTARTAKQDPNKKPEATAKSQATKKPTTATAKKTTQGDKSISFKSSPKSTKAKGKTTTVPSWNLNVARSTAIVRELTQNGLPKARIVLTGQNGKGVTTNEWAATNRGYQVVISPKLDSYYQMMQEGQQGQGTTSQK